MVFKKLVKTFLWLTAKAVYFILIVVYSRYLNVCSWLCFIISLLSLCLTGTQALLSVLDKFRVLNRRNMFVIKETKSAAIFYIRFCRMFSVTNCVTLITAQLLRVCSRCHKTLTICPQCTLCCADILLKRLDI